MRGGGGVYGKGSTLNAQKSPPSALGRWPANVIHDGSPEVLAAFGAFGERISGSAGQVIGKHGFTGFNGGGTGATTYGVADNGRGSAARFYYCAKASAEDRDAGLENMRLILTRRYGEQGQGRTAQQTPRTAVAQANHHPTVKPTELMRYLVRIVTPAGGTVLDPFTGSGSTGRGAVLEGCNFVGIEKDGDYVEIARRRIADAVGPLFC